MKVLASTLARDPQGCSRIPMETFQQVFDRMEKNLQNRWFDFSTIVEYFTRRGEPLTRADLQKLKEEERAFEAEQEKQIKRKEREDKERVEKLHQEMQFRNMDFDQYQELKQQQN